MRVDFDGIKEQEINNFKGGKGSIVLKMDTKKDVTFISARLKPGSSVGQLASVHGMAKSDRTE